MDYESMHGRGISNFSSISPSSHRMPTVSAAQAFQELKTSSTRCISTGLPVLDLGLQNRDPQSKSHEPFFGGVSRGKITEIYGPPGTGKTALGMQLAANALHAGDGVMWVDASHPLPGLRFLHVVQSVCRGKIPSPAPSSQEPSNPVQLLEHLDHFSTPTLAHLLALFSDQTACHPSPNTTLIVIDSLSTLVSNAFPRNSDSALSANKRPGAPKATNPSARKLPILQHLLGSLQRIAATRNIAIVILSQCITKMRPGIGALLVPSINITHWDQGLACRVVLFRDWGWSDEEGTTIDGVRLAQIVKAEGVTLPEGRGWLAGLIITEKGLTPLPLPTFSVFGLSNPPLLYSRQLQNEDPASSPHISSQKRKRSITDLEIPDSEGEDDEDYGWGEEDEEDVPAMPPQWQGSEDILIPEPIEREAEIDEEGSEQYHRLDGDDDIVEADVAGAEVLDSEDELAL